MKKKKRIKPFPIIYGILLTAYAVFALLDAFVLPRDIVLIDDINKNSYEDSNIKGENSEEISNDFSNVTSGEIPGEMTIIGSEQSIPKDPEFAETAEPVITENSYISDMISVTISEFVRYNTQVYVADVVLKDPSYLRAGLAKGAFGRNISDTTSVIAEENNAIFAVNGDYYGFRDRGFVMRNGYLYRETAQKGIGHEDLVIYENGSLEVVKEASSNASELAAAGAVQIFSFGPGLIQNGEITVNENSEVEQSMRSNPRTAIGQIEPLHYVFVVSDGRTSESAGLTLFELAGVMKELNCHTAYNLDGGGSSTMWFMGNVVNHPTSGWHSGERRISDIVCIGE